MIAVEKRRISIDFKVIGEILARKALFLNKPCLLRAYLYSLELTACNFLLPNCWTCDVRARAP